MMRVIMDAPTSDHVAIWYSMRGLGVGSGVVVTSTVKHFCIAPVLNKLKGSTAIYNNLN